MKTIVIDPGHGGNDRANRGKQGYIEADGNLAFALELRDALQGTYRVLLTRERDKTLSLTERGLFAANNGAFLFCSIHSDARSDPAVSGVTVYESVDLADERLAAVVGRAVADAMGIPFRGVKSRESAKYPGEDYYTVIDVAQDRGVPHILLVERGYHTNPSDERKLMDPDIVRKSAQAMAKAIIEFFRNEGDDEVFARTLRKGMKGDDVRQLQEFLNEEGYNAGKADGIFGPNTETGLMRFQKAHGLAVDGIAGPKTFAKINEILLKKQQDNTDYKAKLEKAKALAKQILEV